MSAPKKLQSKKPKLTQLTDVMNFSSDKKILKEELKARLILDSPVFGTVPNSIPPITFHRIIMSINNFDEITQGDLVIGLDRCFSFGVGENKSPEGRLNGYGTSISMYDRDGATERQLRIVQFISVLSSIIVDHLLTDESKKAMNMWTVKEAHLDKINPLYYKRGDKGEIIEGAGATFYPKLIWYGAGKDKKGKDRSASMRSKYYLEDEVDEQGEQVQVDPLDYIGVRHYVTAAIKFESVFIGAKTKNMQCKVYEAEVKAADTGPKRLLKIQSNRTPTIILNGSNPLLNKPENIGESVPEIDEGEHSVAISHSKSSSKVAVLNSTEDESNLQVSDNDNEEQEKKKPTTIRKKISIKK